jgi:hypothetical protein
VPHTSPAGHTAFDDPVEIIDVRPADTLTEKIGVWFRRRRGTRWRVLSGEDLPEPSAFHVGEMAYASEQRESGGLDGTPGQIPFQTGALQFRRGPPCHAKSDEHAVSPSVLVGDGGAAVRVALRAGRRRHQLSASGMSSLGGSTRYSVRVVQPPAAS